jgi:serine/threonine protein kinase
MLLTVLRGDERGRIIVVSSRTTPVLGRGEDADIWLSPKDYKIRRTHVRLDHRGAAWVLREIEPFRNSPEVNGRVGHEFVLADGDEIRLGDTVLRVSLDQRLLVRCANPGCQVDLSALANGDGKAMELHSIATYLCPRHVAVQPDCVGKRIGPYQVCAELGRGGFGAVSRVYDPLTARMFALKRLEVINIDQVRRFDREIMTLKELRHTNIVRFVEAAVDAERRPYFLMEHMSGGSLLDLARQYALRTPPALAIDIILRVLDGLSYLHDHDGFHRDIKPANILLRRDDGDGTVASYTPKIADFGLVKRLDGIRLTKPYDVAGSVHFMAPEQARDFMNVRAAADLYSVGAMLYFCLTGLKPIEIDDRDDDRAQLACVRDQMRIPIRARAPYVPVGLAEVVDRACQHDESRRFATARGFQEALRAAL